MSMIPLPLQGRPGIITNRPVFLQAQQSAGAYLVTLGWTGAAREDGQALLIDRISISCRYDYAENLLGELTLTDPTLPAPVTVWQDNTRGPGFYDSRRWNIAYQPTNPLVVYPPLSATLAVTLETAGYVDNQVAAVIWTRTMPV